MVKKRSRKKERPQRASARRRAQEHQTGYGPTFFRKPEEMELLKVKAAGTSRWLVIPYIAGAGNKWADKGEEYYERTFFIHNNIGVNRERVVCPAQTMGKPCPICELRDSLSADDWSKHEKTIKALSPKERQLMLIIDLKDQEEGVQLFEYSYWNFGKRLDAEINNAEDEEIEEYNNFYDPADGKMLRIQWEEKKIGEKGQVFYEATTISFKTRPVDLDEEIFEDLPCLDELLVVQEYDQLKKMILDMDDDDDEPKRSTHKKKKTTKKKSKKREPEEELEEELEEETEEDEPPFEEDAEETEPEEEIEEGEDDFPEMEEEPEGEEELEEEDKEEPEGEEELDDDGWLNDDDDGVEESEETEEAPPKRTSKKKTVKKKTVKKKRSRR